MDPVGDELSTRNPLARRDWSSPGGGWDCGLVLRNGMTATVSFVGPIDLEATERPFAILGRGNWVERGWSVELGGMTDDEWVRAAGEVLAAQTANTLVSLYDLHI